VKRSLFTFSRKLFNIGLHGASINIAFNFTTIRNRPMEDEVVCSEPADGDDSIITSQIVDFIRSRRYNVGKQGVIIPNDMLMTVITNPAMRSRFQFHKSTVECTIDGFEHDITWSSSERERVNIYEIAKKLASTGYVRGCLSYVSQTEPVFTIEGIIRTSKRRIRSALLVLKPKDDLICKLAAGISSDVIPLIKQLLDVLVHIGNILTFAQYIVFVNNFVPCIDEHQKIYFTYGYGYGNGRRGIIERLAISFSSPPCGSLESEGIMYKNTVSAAEIVYYLFLYYYRVNNPLVSIWCKEHCLSAGMTYSDLQQWIDEEQAFRQRVLDYRNCMSNNLNYDSRGCHDAFTHLRSRCSQEYLNRRFSPEVSDLDSPVVSDNDDGDNDNIDIPVSSDGQGGEGEEGEEEQSNEFDYLNSPVISSVTY